MIDEIRYYSEYQIKDRIPNFQEKWETFLGRSYEPNGHIVYAFVEIPLSWWVATARINGYSFNSSDMADEVIRAIGGLNDGHLMIDESNLTNRMYNHQKLMLTAISELNRDGDYDRFANQNHALFLVFWQNEVTGEVGQWPSASKDSFLWLNGIKYLQAADTYYSSGSYHFSPYTGMYQRISWDGSSDYSQDRNYTKCYNCKLWDRPRTRMVRVIDKRPRVASRLNFSRPKNMCDNCVEKMDNTDRTYVQHPVTHNEDGTFTPACDYLVINYYQGSIGDSRFMEDDVRQTWPQGSVGRYLRRNPDTHVYTIDISQMTMGEAQNYSFSFSTHEHSWNYTPTFYYTHSVRNIPEAEHDFISVDADAADSQIWHKHWGPFMGLELECTVRQDRQDMSTVERVKEKVVRLFHPLDYPNGYNQQGPNQLLYRKHDGSLDSSYGTEYVSMPLALDYWNNYVPDEFWTYLKQNFRALNDNRCGIHIHIPWDSLTIVERWIFLTLLNSLQTEEEHMPLFRLITERDDTYYARWHKLAYDEGRRKSLYPVLSVAIDKTQNDTENNPKYNAVNTQHGATIELRHFQANTGKVGVLSKLQFVAAMWDISYMVGQTFNDWDYEEGPPPEELVELIEHLHNNSSSVMLGWIPRASVSLLFSEDVMKHNRYTQLQQKLARAIDNRFEVDLVKAVADFEHMFDICKKYNDRLENNNIERTG